MGQNAQPRPARHAWIVTTLRSHPLLRALDESVLAELVTGGRVRAFEAGASILVEGEAASTVFFLFTGSVRVFHRHDDGRELLLKLLVAPAMFGEIEVLANCRYGEHVEALDECQLLLMPARLFTPLVLRNQVFAADIINDVARRFCIAVKNLKAVAFREVEARLAGVLLDYVAHCGVAAPNGTLIARRLTQEQLALDLAVTRKAVNAALCAMRERGLLDKHKGRYLVRDLAALRALSNDNVERTFSSRRTQTAPRPAGA